jgi:hypothetical protein
VDNKLVSPLIEEPEIFSFSSDLLEVLEEDTKSNRLRKNKVEEILDFGRRTGKRIGERYLFILKRLKCLNNLKEGKLRVVEKVNLAGGEG